MKQKTDFQIWWVNYFLAPFSWSRWTDILTFTYGMVSEPQLLQGKLNKRTNAKKFRITSLKQKMTTKYHYGKIDMDVLDKNGLIDSQVKFNQ